jgi:colanic acid/amylovoran biosynthesis glycosyltransferase
MQKAGPRVAVVVGDFPRLSETFIVSQICGLLDAGIDVTVFADARDKNGLSHPLLKTRDIMSSARFAGDHFLYRLADTLHRPYRMIMAMKLLATDATDTGLAEDFDVVLCHFGVNGLRALRAKHRGNVKGQIWTAFHGYDLNAHFQHQTRARYSELFREGDLIIPACENFKTQLIGYGAPPDRLWVHRMGVDVELIRPCHTGKRSDPSVRIISVGRLVEKKGLEFAIRALKRVRLEHPDIDWTYEIAGDGPTRPHLQALAVELQIGDRVRFSGALPHTQILEAVSQADIFLLPSVTANNGDVEASPVAISEAMASGLPIIATRHSGVPELVFHNQNGLLAAERDVEELALRLTTLLRDRTMRESFGRQGRKFAEGHLDNRALHKILAERIAEVARVRTR